MTAKTSGREFPLLRLATDTGIDYLDPGLSYTPEGWSVLWNVYLPLLGYKHVNGPGGATIVPYLARALPNVSADGKTYTLVLRRGLKYSDGAPVRASDFEATIERDYRLDSPGVAFFSNIVGAAEYGRTKKGTIAGIASDDATRQITIHLLAPQADFENVLASEFAALVPAGAPASDTSIHPLPATGPYVIKSYQPNDKIVEARNPYFDACRLRGQRPGRESRLGRLGRRRRRRRRAATRDRRPGRLGRLPLDPLGPAFGRGAEVRQSSSGGTCRRIPTTSS